MRWLTIAAALCVPLPAVAQQPFDILATGRLLSGCQALIENVPDGNMMQMGACAGAVSAAMDIGRSLKHACPPADIGVIEGARRVIDFVDESPGRKGEEFGPLALKAFGDRWPCSR